MLSGHAAGPATAMKIHESTKAKLSCWTQVPKIAPFLLDQNMQDILHESGSCN